MPRYTDAAILEWSGYRPRSREAALATVDDRSIILTCEHAQSSHGDPVLVRDGVAYGRADVLDMPAGPVIAAEYVARYLPRQQRMGEAARLLDPEGYIERFARGLRPVFVRDTIVRVEREGGETP